MLTIIFLTNKLFLAVMGIFVCIDVISKRMCFLLIWSVNLHETANYVNGT